ncbi:MAG: hypothetical protein R3D05_16210 [Dongiaceae bacterium]
MRRKHLGPLRDTSLEALAITVPLWLILAFATGTFSWKLALVAAMLFVVLWVLMRGKPPRRYDTPPSPDEWWRLW